MSENYESEDPLGNMPEFSVSELSFAVKRTVEDNFGYVRVRGEVGRVSRPGSGHIYLDLKDEKAVLNGVVWKGVASRLKIQPEQGLEVVCSGKLTTFPGQSRYQIVIDQMEPAGVGALMALLEERRKKLTAEGLFDEAHKKPLPYLPEVIGVVTSPSGAVIRDILHRLYDRFPRHVLIWPVLVQGDKAADQIAEGIRGFNRLEAGGKVPRPDVLIVARGGGSIEDLWAFNEEVVVRAAFESEIPLISAVGHETDTTLIDFASDRRAPTPTAAAEMAVPVIAELKASTLDLAARLGRAQARTLSDQQRHLEGLARGLPRLEDMLALPSQRLDSVSERLKGSLALYIERRSSELAEVGRVSLRPLNDKIRAGELQLATNVERIRNASLQGIERRGSRIETLSAGLSAQSPEKRLQQNTDRLIELGQRLHSAGMRKLEQESERLNARAQLLKSYSYHGVLERGFALVLNEAGQVVRQSSDLSAGDGVALRFVDGEKTARIDGKPAKKAASPGPNKGPKKAPKKAQTQGASQGSLFD